MWSAIAQAAGQIVGGVTNAIATVTGAKYEYKAKSEEIEANRNIAWMQTTTNANNEMAKTLLSAGSTDSWTGIAVIIAVGLVVFMFVNKK